MRGAPGKVVWRGSRLPAALWLDAAGVAGGVAAAVVANGGGVSPASGCEELTGGSGAVGRWRSFGKQSATWWAKAWVKQSVRASSCEVEKRIFGLVFVLNLLCGRLLTGVCF